MTNTITQTATTSNATSQASTKSSAISSDFETFLKMLTVQMRNQDPLNPTEGADYAVQLATFSGVEQQVKTNDLITALGGKMQSDGLAALANWIGREVPATTPINFDGTPRSLVIEAPADAEVIQVEIRDATGTIVQRVQAPLGTQSLQWAGTTDDGSTMPSGQYSFTTVALKDGEQTQSKATPVYQRVTEVSAGADDGTLTLASGHKIAVSSVKSLREAS